MNRHRLGGDGHSVAVWWWDYGQYVLTSEIPLGILDEILPNNVEGD